MTLSSTGPDFQQIPKRYKIDLFVSGSGHRVCLGSGTLEQGKKLCGLLEELWELRQGDNPLELPEGSIQSIMSMYEGSDIIATSLSKPNDMLVYTDKWEKL